ncbi:MAG: phosphatidate cytidylyltransferase [Deltaproteobacteria bacterium]
MLTKRLYSTIILVPLITAALFNRFMFFAVILAFSVCGLYEFYTMLERKGISIYKYFGIGMGAIIPLSIMVRFELTKKWELLFIVCALLFLTIMQFKRRQNSGAVVGISTTLFGLLYVSWFFSFLVKIRLLDNGWGLLTSLIIMTKLADVGAYLIGSRFGSHLLIPRISPNKSIEGALGGLAFSVLGAFACQGMLPFSYWQLTIIGLMIGVVGQLGDLSESLMKRDCEIKDSSDVIPGIGGVLDLIDSLLFTAPVFYFYITIVLNYVTKA